MRNQAHMTDLYTMLESCREEGAFQSEGEFTVKGEQAWEKLAAFQLPVEEGWVLKVVQAVCADKGTSMDVEQNYYESKFLIRGVANWNRKELEEAVFFLGIEATSSLAHLAVAVRALAQMRDRPFSIRYCDGERRVWDGERFQLTGNFQDPVVPSSLEITVGHLTFAERQTPYSTESSPALRVCYKIARVLREHCHLASHLITLEGHSIGDLRNDPDYGVSPTVKPIALLRRQWEGLPQLLLPGADSRIEFCLENQSVQLAAVDEQEISTAVILSAFSDKKKNFTASSATGGHAFLWVRHGVVVHRERIQLPRCRVGMAVLLSAEGLKTDLSGLVPRESEEKQARKNSALAAAHQAVSEVRGRVKTKPSVKRPLTSALLGALCLTKAAPLGLLVVGLAGSDYLTNRRKTSAVQRTLEESLENLTKELDKVLRE